MRDYERFEVYAPSVYGSVYVVDSSDGVRVAMLPDDGLPFYLRIAMAELVREALEKEYYNE